MKIAVVGLGYIGLPTALIMAASGNEIVGIDLNEEVVKSLNNGVVTFEEDGLEDLFQRAREKNIRFVSSYEKADMYIISVPTPYEKESKKIDPSYVVKACKSVAEVAKKGAIIVIESTISPGVIDTYVRPALSKDGHDIGEDVHLVHAPERIIPGNMVYELEHNSRTIGADEVEIAEQVKEIYASFCKGEIILTDIRTAELSKVVENTFRDINIAFANELARICHEANTDVYEVIRIANHHPRVNILSPGPGVGGHCISVDPWFLVGDFPEESKLIHQARLTNDGQPMYVWERVQEILAGEGFSEETRVGLYGLTYKENVDDCRESPSLQLLEQLEEKDITNVPSFDPFIKKDIVENQYHDFESFLENVDFVIVMVAHNHIKKHANLLEGKAIFDSKNVLAESALDKRYTL